MKNLKEYIIEGIFDTDEDTIDKNIKDLIKQFLKDNFVSDSLYKISDKPNADGKYEVSCNGSVVVKNQEITSLTNGLFIWANIDGYFSCYHGDSLTSLEGAPKKVGGRFSCEYCFSLKSLEGAPEKVGGVFDCNACHSLISLKGAPEKVGGNFNCSHCTSLTSLKGAPKEVDGYFSCKGCKSLKSLNGAPKKVGNDFICSNCHIAFTINDVKKVSNVKGIIKA